ncbi:MAG: hypothetical protein U1F46_13175 [Marinagarivorans sp.]
MNRLLALTALTSVLYSGQAAAWEHRHHHHRDSDAAVALIGGLVLGAAIADSSNRSSYSSSSTYYSSYPSSYSSRTTYYPDYSYSRPYYSERVYVREPETTTYYYGPTYTYSEPRRHYPAHKRVEHVYYPETRRDEYGNCYSVQYRDGRKVLKEIPRYHCSND